MINKKEIKEKLDEILKVYEDDDARFGGGENELTPIPISLTFQHSFLLRVECWQDIVKIANGFLRSGGLMIRKTPKTLITVVVCFLPNAFPTKAMNTC